MNINYQEQQQQQQQQQQYQHYQIQDFDSITYNQQGNNNHQNHHESLSQTSSENNSSSSGPNLNVQAIQEHYYQDEDEADTPSNKFNGLKQNVFDVNKDSDEMLLHKNLYSKNMNSFQQQQQDLYDSQQSTNESSNWLNPEFDQFVICVDPDSRRIYSQAINQDIIIIEEKVPQYIYDQAEDALKDMDIILKNTNPNWMFSKEAKEFRTRKIPTYLLHKDISDYPMYLSQSKLSQAFMTVFCIKLRVNLQQYKQQLNDGQGANYYQQPLVHDYNEIERIQGMDFMEQGEGDIDEAEENTQKIPGEIECIEIEAGLVTVADEVIKNILREIYKKYRQKLEPKQGNKLILQVAGFKEYIMGNYPMLQFERVRFNLRGLEHLDLVLTEIPKYNKKDELFPPIISRNLCEVRNSDIQKIEWEQYKDIPMLIWYPPVPLPKKKEKLKPEDRIIFLNKEKSGNWNGKGKKSFQTINKKLKEELCQQYGQSKQNDEQQSQQQYQSIEEFNSKIIENQKKFLPSDNILYSGECDQLFRVRVIGLTNLQAIFTSTYDKLAKDDQGLANGEMPPQFVTLKREIQKMEGFSRNIVKEGGNKAVDDFPVEEVKPKKKKLRPILKFVKVNQSNNNTELSQNVIAGSHNIKHSDHGMKGTKEFENVTKKYDLDCYPYQINVEASVYFGSNLLTSKSVCITKSKAFQNAPKFYEWLEFDGLKLSQIQKEVRVGFNVVVNSEKVSQIIASASFLVFDENGKLNQGPVGLNLWPFYKIDPRMSCMQQFWNLKGEAKKELDEGKIKNLTKFLSQQFAQLHIQLDSFELPMYYSLRDNKIMEPLGFAKLKKRVYESQDENNNNNHKLENWNMTPKTDDLARLESLLSRDPLTRKNYTENEKFILMICRNHYKTLTNALQIFLCAIDWSDPAQIMEAHHMLQTWEPVTPQDALPLINAQFADEQVRLYAVQRISNFYDDEFGLYMLEMIQTLFYENKHYSPLGEMMLERALMNPNVVGHEYFYQMKSQLHLKASFERFYLYIEQFTMLSGSFRKQIANELIINEEINNIGQTIKAKPETKDNKEFIKENIPVARKMIQDIQNTTLSDGQSFNLALDSRMQSEKFDIQKCKLMDSKKKPLWLVMENAYLSSQYIKVIFKCGDDIRQDQLTIQLIKIMDKIWLDNGHDFRMKPYQVLSTSDQVGMIEVVNDSQTTSDIHQEFGGMLGALQSETIWKFLKRCNKDPHMFEIATENFLKSCAGYCVATYILGIGDRHSGNIMLTKTGHLFHIDFGHFLGNFKTKFGFRRERTPFVFTEEMAFVMGGKTGKLFKKFECHCTEAYNLIRQHGNFLINIFLLMISAGMPELQNPSDIEYLKQQLSLEMSEQQATKKFKDAIYNSLDNPIRKLDNLFHMLKRK